MSEYIQKEYRRSVRSSCALLNLPTSSYYYSSDRDEKDAPLREELRSLARKRPRWGYRMLREVLCRERDEPINHKRVYRLYREEGLQVAVRKKRKRICSRGKEGQVKREPVTQASQRWSMDFMSDQLANGRRIRLLNIIDEYTRECLAMEVDVSLSGERVCRVLDRLVKERGHPENILSDNGPEFTGKALNRWAYEHCVRHEFIEPGKPVQNAYIESFNGTVRDEFLNEHWFLSLEDTRQKSCAFRKDYNEYRPHSSLGGKSPIEFARGGAACMELPLRATPCAPVPCKDHTKTEQLEQTKH